jgi:hypothetical protein
VRAFRTAPDSAPNLCTRCCPPAAPDPPGAQTVCEPAASRGCNVSHRGLNVIVSCNILQRKGIRILSCLSLKGVTESMQASIGMCLDLLPRLAYLFFEHPRPKRLCRILGTREDIVALGVFQKPFEHFLHFVINHQLALSRAPLRPRLMISSPQIFLSLRRSECIQTRKNRTDSARSSWGFELRKQWSHQGL